MDCDPDSIEMQVYSETGDTIGRYYFFNPKAAKRYGAGEDQPGWYNADMYDDDDYPCDKCDDDIIPFGVGTMLMSGEYTTITFSGEVVGENKDYDVAGDNGFTWCGNCSPVQVNLEDLAIPTEIDCDPDSIEMQVYSETGDTIGRYYFFNPKAAKRYGAGEDQPGWYDADMYDDDDYPCDYKGKDPIPAGKMVMIMSGEYTTITVPTALPKAD